MVTSYRERAKDFCSRRSWICEEGLSSRDQLRSKEKREQGQWQEDPTDWSHNNRDEPYALHRLLRVCMYVGYSVEKRVHTQDKVR
jgi:hypothetical protein